MTSNAPPFPTGEPHPTGEGSVERAAHPRQGLGVRSPALGRLGRLRERVFPDVPVPAAVYIVIISFGGLLLGVAHLSSLGPREFPSLLPLLALTALAARLQFGVYSQSRVSVSFACIFAIAVLHGAPGAVLAAAVNAVSGQLASRQTWCRFTLSLGMGVLANLAVAHVYHGITGFLDNQQPLVLLLPTLLAGATGYMIRGFLIGLFIFLVENKSGLPVWRETFRWLLPSYLALGVLGLGIALAYQTLGLFSLLPFAIPPAMMHYSMKQYVDRTEAIVRELRDKNEQLERTNTELQRANQELQQVSGQLRTTYDETLQALMTLVETRGAEAKGHANRVMDIALLIAAELGLREGTEEWRDLRWAALLHDVGKIGVADEILRKPGALTEEEWEQMRLHPHLGFQMLEEVHFLRRAADLVYAHHEWFNGKGYPLGRKGKEIPLGARILAVAEAFEAIVTGRPYREPRLPAEARMEILRCSGTQFDPEVVVAFLLVYPRVAVWYGG